MLSELQKRWLAEHVYLLDSTRKDQNKNLQKGTIHAYVWNNPTLGQFQVLKVEDNIENGMQAMAVAPVINGIADTSQIVIAYAGTNVMGVGDLPTDIQMIGLGNTSTVRLKKGTIQKLL